MIQSVIMVLFLAMQGWTMEPYYPEKMELESKDSKLVLEFSEKSDPIVMELPDKKLKYTWKNVRAYYPSQLIFNSKSKGVFFLGGLGDAGVDLGKVVIHEIKTGKIVRSFDLRTQMPDLEKMSRQYHDMGNFVWISKTDLSDDGNSVIIEVCEKKKVIVNFDSDSVKVEDLKK